MGSAVRLRHINNEQREASGTHTSEGTESRWTILTGIAGNICVLFTANDAHMRG